MPRCALSAALALAALAVPGAASAHTGGANCTGSLAGATGRYVKDGKCKFAFQGFPIGVAGVYDSNPENLEVPGSTAAEIHVEVKAQLANGLTQPLGIECIEVTTGIARCELEDDGPLGEPMTAPEPAPQQIVGLVCEGHSHAPFSTVKLPAGRFACWSTDEARTDLEGHGWFRDNGFPSEPAPEPEPPAPGPLDPLSGAGLGSVVTTVPINTYAPSTVVASRSLGLKYVNVDTARHDVVALEAKRSNSTAPWCATFDEGKCPLFWTPLIPGGGNETPVLGLEDAHAGESYAFYCSIHPYMTGTLEVVE